MTRIPAALRRALCRMLGCQAFDRKASEIVDVATAEADRLREVIEEADAEMRALRAGLRNLIRQTVADE